MKLIFLHLHIFRLAGRHFTFSSPQDICRVLYHEMKFPVNGDPKLNLRQVKGSVNGDPKLNLR